MFNGRNFIAKYKNYIECAKSLKNKYTKTNKSKQLLDEVSNRCNNFVLKYKGTLSAIQSKVNAKNECSEKSTVRDISERIPNVLKNLPISNRTKVLLAGTGALFSPTSNVVSVTGYNANDIEILEQLGVLTPANTPNSQNASNVNVTNNINDISNASTETLNSSNVSYDAINVPSLNQQYTSIFDNMPPESARNDIYTTFMNSFNYNTTNQPVITDSATNLSLTNDIDNEYLIIETPGNNVNELNESVLVDTTNYETTNESSVIEPPIVDAIPEPPPIPDATVELASQLNALGEQTFASLGLGGWGPVGLVQNAFEFLHVTVGMPWWGAIALGTVVIRTLMFPLVVVAQRNAAKMNNVLPAMQVLQVKMTEARTSGNQLEAARYSQELMLFMKEKGVNPFKNMIVPLAQAPIFISFFVGLREMANVPVDSLRTGGLFWFTDLTVPDQFFALPVLTSLTLWLTIELGTDSARLTSQNLQTMKYVLRAMPIVILPFVVNFPGVILCYWVSSNFISLVQVGFLKIPSVRTYFQIDSLIKHDPSKLPIKNKGFVGGMKDSWTNIKIGKELEERKHLDELQFQRAGKGPLVKTYKYDPTKEAKNPANAISAKNR